MRQIRTFSSSFNSVRGKSKQFSEPSKKMEPINDLDPIETEANEEDIYDDREDDYRSEFSERGQFSTPNLIKQQIRELGKRPNVRMLRLVKSCKTVARTLKTPEDINNLKRIIVKEISFMLSEYSEMLNNNPSLRLNIYFRINSILPEVSKESIELSKVMIRCSKIHKAQGALPKKNQKDLSSAIDTFINTIVNSIVGDNLINTNPLL